MFNGEEFKFFPVGDLEKQVKCKAITRDEFNRVFMLYDYTKLYGLPLGKGWAQETSKTMRVIRFFQTLTTQIENWQMKRSSGNG